MSIHFRSRIANNNGRPVVNGANVVGWCCSLNAQTVLARCLGGGFFPGATDGSNCNVPVSCTGGPVSLTSGGACCYWKKNNQNYIQVCETTEDNTECFF